jgi:hypothetical protein
MNGLRSLGLRYLTSLRKRGGGGYAVIMCFHCLLLPFSKCRACGWGILLLFCILFPFS